MPALIPHSKSNLHILSICALLISADGLSDPPLPLDRKLEGTGYTLHFSSTDNTIEQVDGYIKSGLDLASSFFGKPYKSEVSVFVYPSRYLLDKQWRKAWGAPDFNSACWMVGSGVESRLDLLSPSAWGEEACEHDPKDPEEIKLLVHHELVHILHSDYNQSPSFEDINNIDWFVEGLATYVSGQLTQERVQRVAESIRADSGPKELSMFWQGVNKYGQSGSLVEYIDRQWGHDVLIGLLEFSDVNDILSTLGNDEQQLINGWRSSVLGEN